VRQKVVAAAAVAVLIGGGAFAAVSAIGGGDGKGHRRSHVGHVRRHLQRQSHQQRGPAAHGLNGLGRFAAVRPLPLATAHYLGIAPAQLRRDLRSGKTLAQVADATPGKSKAGLLDALVATRRRRLLHGVTAGKLAPARAARRVRRLRERMDKLVTHKFVRGPQP
jgi:hypothetical protein